MDADGAEKKGNEDSPAKRNIRRYYCPHCGICRSKRALIASHVASKHKDKSEDSGANNTENDIDTQKGYTCEECGATFRKPAYLKQHMQGHSVERPFCCPIDGCSSSYQRKDHLIRHMCSHQGKMFTCPLENCKRQFVFLANMKRHIAKYHAGDTPGGARKLQSHACPEVGCGKSFKFLSKLKKHQLTHVKLESVERICTEPGCGEFLSNTACLKAHIHSCHSHVMCPVCGTHQLRKNFKRHQHTHEDGRTEEKTIKCSYDGCSHMFTNKSNLNAHVKAVHLKQKPFTCGIFGCGKKFSFRHVRDNHEKCGIHICARGDFLEADLQFRSRPRGGRLKRKFEGVDMLLKKRVALPGQEHVLDNPSEYLSWVLGGNE